MGEKGGGLSRSERRMSGREGAREERKVFRERRDKRRYE
jgi:hypothetical protein